MASVRRLLLGGGGRLWFRLLVTCWLLLLLALLSTRLLGRGCRKRTFAYRDQLEDSTHGEDAFQTLGVLTISLALTHSIITPIAKQLQRPKP